MIADVKEDYDRMSNFWVFVRYVIIVTVLTKCPIYESLLTGLRSWVTIFISVSTSSADPRPLISNDSSCFLDLNTNKIHLEHEQTRSAKSRSPKEIFKGSTLDPERGWEARPLPTPRRPDRADQPANNSASESRLRGEQCRWWWARVKEEIKIYKEVVVGKNQFMLTWMML